MNRFLIVIFLMILPSLQGCLQTEDEPQTSTIRLATTTSLQDSGLLTELLPTFTDRTGTEIDVIAVGSGAAMSLAQNNDVDVLIVHDPIREMEFIADGFAEMSLEIYRKPLIISLRRISVLYLVVTNQAPIRKNKNSGGCFQINLKLNSSKMN